MSQEQYKLNYRKGNHNGERTHHNGNTRTTRVRSRDNRPGIIKFFADVRTHYAIGILFIITAIVMLIMCISHLRTGADDFSSAAWKSISEIADEGTAENAGGALGAKLSYLLMTEGLGVGAFALVIYLICIGLRLLKVIHLRFWPFTFKCLFTAISCSIIFGLFTLNSNSLFHWGGRHGHEINLFFVHTGSILLAYAVTIALICCLGCIYLHQLTSFVKSVRSKLPKVTPRHHDHKKVNAQVAFSEEEDADENMIRSFDDQTESFVTASPEESVEDNNDIQQSQAHDNLPQNGEFSTIDSFSSPRNDNSTQSDKLNSTEIPFKVEIAGADDENVSDDEIRGSQQSDKEVDNNYYDPRAELSHYHFPTLELLEERDSGAEVTKEELEGNKEMLVKALNDYKIKIDSITATVGPSVTLYEIVPAEGVRIYQIRKLEDDIARNLSALGIRIIAPIPGKGTVGIEVPNRKRRMVSIREVLGSKKFRTTNYELPIALGRNIENEVYIQDLASIPHLLVAGATGQGKSVGLNCILASLLYAKHPAEMKLVLVDPKKVEFSAYARLYKHFLITREEDMEDPIITDPERAMATLQSLCTEMDNRYELLKAAGVNKIQHYNRKITEKRLAPTDGHHFLPYIVVIVDEYADLVMMGAKDISLSIARIAQKGRAAGIHIIIATQRPSTDVITGMIKANFPGRMAFRVMQSVDSKTILDCTGANQLIGYGDMLFRVNGPMDRVQCAFIDTDEIERVTEFIENQTGCLTKAVLPETPIDGGAAGAGGVSGPIDAMFAECARFIVTQPTASTSSLQRRFRIGYNKAGSIMDQLEALRVVGPAQGQKPRAVLMDADALEDMLRTL